MAEVDAGLMAQAVAEYEQAGHGSKQQVLMVWLPILGIGRQTFYRELRAWGRSRERRKRRDLGRRTKAEINGWVGEIMRIKHSPPKAVRRGATVDAIRYAVANGLVPEEVMAVPVGTINRVAREMGWTEAPRREARFEAEYPNQVHQIDASGSEHWYPVRKDGGDWILKLRPGKLKNKEKIERMRVWAYGLTDDFSGYRLSRYVVAPGESAAGGIGFLQWAWSKDQEHAPFRGLPEILYMDNGPLARKTAMRDFCERVGVSIETHEPYRSQATGKVEVNWRSMWKRFETPWFFNPKWEKLEISLGELNQELAAFWKEWNGKQHRRLEMSREAAWLTILQRGGVVDIDPAAWGTIFQRAKRLVDAAGCFDYQGKTYQVREIQACEVWVYENLISPSPQSSPTRGEGVKGMGTMNCAPTGKKGVKGLVVEDRRDGARYGVVEFKPRVWGDYLGVKKTELEKLKEVPREGAMNCAPTWRRENDGKVMHLVRGAEVRDGGHPHPSPLPSRERELPESVEELAAGAGILHRQDAGATGIELYATPLERYVAVKVKEAKGERLEGEDRDYLRWFEGEYKAQWEMLKEDIDRRVRLAGN